MDDCVECVPPHPAPKIRGCMSIVDIIVGPYNRHALYLHMVFLDKVQSISDSKYVKGSKRTIRNVCPKLTFSEETWKLTFRFVNDEVTLQF